MYMYLVCIKMRFLAFSVFTVSALFKHFGIYWLFVSDKDRIGDSAQEGQTHSGKFQEGANPNPRGATPY